eukprot:6153164-Lingulodinium_polyedra.AAC.1
MGAVERRGRAGSSRRVGPPVPSPGRARASLARRCRRPGALHGGVGAGRRPARHRRANRSLPRLPASDRRGRPRRCDDQ